MKEQKISQKVFVGTAQRSAHLEDLGAGGRKMSKSGVWSGMKRLKEQMWYSRLAWLLRTT